MFVEKRIQHFSILVAGCQNEAGNAVHSVNEREIYYEAKNAISKKKNAFLPRTRHYFLVNPFSFEYVVKYECKLGLVTTEVFSCHKINSLFLTIPCFFFYCRLVP